MNRQGTWRRSPTYDMTYILDTGGHLPNKEHCLMIGGKLQGIATKYCVSEQWTGRVETTIIEHLKEWGEWK